MPAKVVPLVTASCLEDHGFKVGGSWGRVAGPLLFWVAARGPGCSGPWLLVARLARLLLLRGLDLVANDATVQWF